VRLLAEPLQAAAAGKTDAHHVPLAVHGMAEGVQPPLWIDFDRVAVDEHDARGADRGRQAAAADDAVAHGPRRAIAGAADHQAIGGQAQQFGGLAGERAGWLLGFVAIGQQRAIELELFQQLRRPVALGHVQQQHAAGVADVGGHLAGHAAADVIFGEQDFPGLVEVPGLVIAEPENFGSGETGQGRIGDHADQFGPPAGAALQLVALGRRSLIVPQQRAANDLVVLVEKNRAVHLAREADRLDVSRFEFGFLDDRADGLDRGLPPVFRLLLAPQRLGVVRGVEARGLGQDFPLFVDRQRLGARGADVDAEKAAHCVR
jgi:hypothetical protein